ncbi:hypothetical protein ACFOHK_11890 [Falsigemmobacter intermedius]|uniref:Uncharacterized protein n=1 Tax=Falsigemmobacter intermedius TaxID=1553448 RepID=A0A444MCY1_9RHOB|nr:hypothetical protein [Falsigemmobacter intermedius]RWY42206.1 hypothetical protein EP867_07435 [Falsigemmobacter intermedius]
MTRPTPLLWTASARTVLSGLLVLLLMLVWQFSPGLRLSRSAGGAERVTAVLRTALPPEAVKFHQIAPAARTGDDGASGDLPFAALLPHPQARACDLPGLIRAPAGPQPCASDRMLRPGARAPPASHSP